MAKVFDEFEQAYTATAKTIVPPSTGNVNYDVQKLDNPVRSAINEGLALANLGAYQLYGI